MKASEAQQEFIQAWGKLGSSWGINRTMAQIHALLLINEQPLSAEEVMEALQISRGNANMNLRALMDWQLVEKVLLPGERKEFFKAEKDIWLVAQRVMVQRKRKELEPMLKVLDNLSREEIAKDKKMKEFQGQIAPIRKFATQVDSILDSVSKADNNWFVNKMLKIVK